MGILEDMVCSIWKHIVNIQVNTGQLTEHELNFIAQNIIDKAKTFPSASEGFKYILSFVKEVNEEQYKEMVIFFNSLGREDKIGFVKSIFENGLYLHQPPFWNNVTFDEIMKLYKKYPWIKPYKCTIEGKEIEKPLIIAPMYMLKLKHQPLGKFSVRDTSYLNNKNVPSKNKSYKDKKAIYSNTPIRLGL